MTPLRITACATALMLASAGGAFACEPGETLDGTLTLSDLTQEQGAAFATLFAPELRILNDEDIAPDAAFGFGSCDITRDGEEEIIVHARPGPFCEADCTTWAIGRTDGVWQILLAAEGGVQIAESLSMGAPDLIARVPGFPAIVHKFDGASYRDALEGLIYGEVFELPDAGAWQADESGFVGIVLGSAGPNGEAILALDAVTPLAGSSLDGLTTGLTDLNGDAVPEVVVQGTGPDFCSAQGCQTWVVNILDDTALVLASVQAQGSLEVAATSTNGLRDLIVWGQAGASILRYDGAVYR